jgi:YbbR domain-containing protein
MKRLIFENFELKVMAVVIAIVLWAYVGSRQVLERRMTLRIEYSDIPAGITLGSNVKTSFQTTLIGRKDGVLDLSPEDLKATVSLKGYVAGQKEMLVHPKIQNLPNGVTANLVDYAVPLVIQEPPKDAPKKKGKK